MNYLRKLLPIGLAIGFLLLGLVAFFQSKPTPKNGRIYNTVKQYSPYYMEKRFGGIQIKSTIDPNFQEKPSNMEVYRRLESLEKTWAQSHLKVNDNTLFILDDNQTLQLSLPLLSKEEQEFVHLYFGIE